jgi:hypothetical protein
MAKTTATTYTTNIPEYAQPYVTNLLGQAEALTDINKNPYQAYEGQRRANFTPMQQQAFQGIAGLAPSLAGRAGQGWAAQGIMGAFNPQSWTQPGTSQQFMSPYMQGVVDIQQREAQRQADMATQGRNAQAVKAGAFGGSRQAITDAEAARNLAFQKGDIQAQGLQQAYDRGMAQFNAEQANRMQGLNVGIQGANVLGQLGQQDFSQQQQALQMQNQAGTQQQEQEQKGLTMGYQDFMDQLNYPYKQLTFMSDMARGTSGLQTQTGAYTNAAQPSLMNQLAGLGTMGAGLTMKAAGGMIDRPAGLMELAMRRAA